MRFFNGLLAGLLLCGSAWADDGVMRVRVRTGFVETREAVTTAIENRGLVVNYVSHVADMLERTGADIGASRQVFAKAEIIEFCSAVLSRRMMEADPHNIVLCPFAISVYALPGETGTWLAYRRPVGKAAGAVDELLAGIIAEASE